jgi:Flp pilus assembly pilin Flp
MQKRFVLFEAVQNRIRDIQNLFPPGDYMHELLRRFWSDEQGQDIAEYAVMVAVILIIVVGTVRLIGTNSNTVFSNVASTIQ